MFISQDGSHAQIVQKAVNLLFRIKQPVTLDLCIQHQLIMHYKNYPRLTVDLFYEISFLLPKLCIYKEKCLDSKCLDKKGLIKNRSLFGLDVKQIEGKNIYYSKFDKDHFFNVMSALLC